MTAAAVARMAELADDLAAELDLILDRVIAPDPVLRIVREQAGLPSWMTRWSVVNTATGERMLPWTTNLGFALRFGVAFVERHQGSVLDESFGAFSNEDLFSGLAGEPKADPQSVSQVGEPASPAEDFSVRVPSNVLPFRREGVA